MPALKLCVECGEPCTDGRCVLHRPVKDPGIRLTRAQTGYTARWDRLSLKARRLQPWCNECGSPEDLTADHLRWPALTLADVQVLCRSCNSIKGAIRTNVREGTGEGVDEHTTGPRGMANISTQLNRPFTNKGPGRG